MSIVIFITTVQSHREACHYLPGDISLIFDVITYNKDVQDRMDVHTVQHNMQEATHQKQMCHS